MKFITDEDNYRILVYQDVHFDDFVIEDFIAVHKKAQQSEKKACARRKKLTI